MPESVQDTVVAIRRGGDSLVVSNIQGDVYPDATFSVDPNQVLLCSQGLGSSISKLNSYRLITAQIRSGADSGVVRLS